MLKHPENYFCKAKTLECDQKKLTTSAKYVMDVMARVSLKVATNGFFGGKNNLTIQQF